MVKQVLEVLGASNTPAIEVYNKSDLCDTHLSVKNGSVLISARDGTNLDVLLSKVETELNRSQIRVELTVPYERYDAVSVIRENGTILSETHEQDGAHIVAMLESDRLYKVKNALGTSLRRRNDDQENLV